MARKKKKKKANRQNHRGLERTSAKRRVAHVRRQGFARGTPVHVTIGVRKGVIHLQSPKAMAVIRTAFSVAKERLGMRLTQYSVQANHIHLIVEAENRHALSRAMKGLCVRIARRLNRATGRKGAVFADRYHAHILRSPREIRNAIRYVAENTRIHAKRAGRRWSNEPDPYSGGPCRRRFLAWCREVIVEPRALLLRHAWRLPWVRPLELREITPSRSMLRAPPPAGAA